MNKLSFLELFRHTHLHRKRVSLLARHLCEQEEAVAIPAEWFINLIDLHDVEKYFFLPGLWLYTGGRGNRKHARRFYDLMNQVGNLIRALYAWIWLPFAAAEWIQYSKAIECIADVVDRNCHGLTRFEMGQPVKPDLSQFLDGWRLERGRRLASNYEIIIPAEWRQVPERFSNQTVL